ncbi:hypothetical protein GH714_017630 [Hevea brasiliensis]|uniref:NAD-dependent epimerase/dehydratase domain-containing protein n=1 Tax=Hevea brasiliensis TaxID=3981 RepID=A0A6A6N1S1_HEVBR|nr:hypothetical protein GH714_017630 [Hevea brasiliensis]
MSGEGKVVCVTGGSGYIASWLLKFLLQRGYTVKATVRDPDDPKKTAHLRALDGAKERLHLFKANLLEEGAFDAVVDGCDGVFHTASPVIFSTNEPQAELIDPAVKGTLNVLKSCKKVQFIKRVVITSSMATVLYGRKPLTPDVVVDETWQSDPAVCKEMKLWYMLAKTFAEEAAWNFAEENVIDLVTIHPAYVIGPLLQPTLNFSVEMILNLVNGAQTYPNTYYRSTDVRDVAEAHIRAFEIPAACGRYCLVANESHFSEVLKIVHEHFPPCTFLQSDPKKTDHLLALDGAKERLHLFKADLLEEGSFDSAIDGCEGVFHAASPVLISATDPQAELIDPAVKGTLNVLKSCTKVQSIKRVVITSSIATVMFDRKPQTPDVVVDETWHSDPAVCKEMKLSYMLAKTLAEKAAWNFAKENAIDLVTIHPAYVIGPLLQPTLNASVAMIFNLVNGSIQQPFNYIRIINGAQTYPNEYYGSTDVRTLQKLIFKLLRFLQLMADIV